MRPNHQILQEDVLHCGVLSTIPMFGHRRTPVSGDNRAKQVMDPKIRTLIRRPPQQSQSLGDEQP
jgi:hypothetical protein